MRESVLKALAEKAAHDPAFLRAARRDLAGTLKRHGYELTAEEMSAVESLRRRTAIVGDAALAAMLAGGLQGRGGRSTGPAPPARPGFGLPKPARPGGPARGDGRARPSRGPGDA